MNAKTKNALMIAIPLLVGLTVILVLNKKKNKPKYTPVESTNINVSVVKKTKFPLKNGSKGELVIQLQQILNSKGANLTVDGDWGPKTDAAMQQYLGISQVSDQEQYNRIVDGYKSSLHKSATIVIAYGLSVGLMAAWNSNSSLKFVATRDFAATVVMIDYLKNTTPTGQYINIKKGQVLSRSEFKPVDIAINGMLVMKYSSILGVMSGHCIFNPEWISLV